MVITISGLLSIILIVVLSRSSNKPARVDITTGNEILTCGIRYKILAVIIGLQTPLIILWVFPKIFSTFDFVAAFFTAIIGSLVYGGIKLFYMSLRYKIELSPTVIIEKRLIRDPVAINWDKIIKILQVGRAIEVYSVDGRKIRIPQTMDGYPTLLERVNEKRPKSTTNRKNL